MEDKQLLRGLKRGEEQALEAAIERYSGYVSAVISNRLGSFSTPEDVEELCADVFAALWKNRQGLKTTHLRGWLGATARNAAVSYIRRQQPPELSQEDVVIISGDSVEALSEARERRKLIGSTLKSLSAPDSEVFLRYYYYGQGAAEIAGEMKLNASTVTTKLHRAREKLRQQLIKGGYSQ